MSVAKSGNWRGFRETGGVAIEVDYSKTEHQVELGKPDTPAGDYYFVIAAVTEIDGQESISNLSPPIRISTSIPI